LTGVPHNRLTHGEAEVQQVASVLRSGMWAMGPQVRQLEADLAGRLGRKHAVAVGSGLGALRLTLLGLGIQPGDDVLVPAYSCVALPNAVLSCGARPVAVDVLPDRLTIDPAAAAAAAGPRTRAIVAVHTFGVPADIAALRRTGLALIEDCAHGIAVAGMGSLGDAAITSFYATKLIGAGEGGAIISDNAQLGEFAARSRDYGDQAADARRLNDKMTDIAAALARSQLARLAEMIERREAIARRYREALAPLAENGRLVLPWASGSRIWYRFAIGTPNGGAEAFAARLRRRGIGAELPVCDWRDDPSVHLVSTRLYRSLVSLPIYPTLTAAEQDAVIAAVHEACRDTTR